MKAYTNIGNKTYKIDKKDIIISKVEYIKVIQVLHKLYLYKKQHIHRHNK